MSVSQEQVIYMQITPSAVVKVNMFVCTICMFVLYVRLYYVCTFVLYIWLRHHYVVWDDLYVYLLLEFNQING